MARARLDENHDGETPDIRKGNLDRATLRSIAVNQRGVLVCILVYILLVIVQFFLPQDIRIFLAAPALITVVMATIFVFLLSTKVYGTFAGIFFALFTMVPCLGLVMLLVINGKATSVLRLHGIQVGFLGADLSQFG